MDCTVIIPSYNPGKFIFELFDDLHQDISKSRADVIVVDDKSTDGSFSELLSLSESTSWLTVEQISEKAFEAHLPRIEAARLASTEWITPIDADDRVENGYVEKMMMRQQETNADIVLPIMRVFSYSVKYSQLYAPVKNFDIREVYRGKDLIKETLNGWRISGNGGLYRRKDYLKRSEEFAPIPSFVYNDEIFLRHLLLHSERVAFAEVDYYYRVNLKSITQTPSLRNFQFLTKNSYLRQFVSHNFGTESVEWERISLQSFYQLIEMMQTFNRLPDSAPYKDDSLRIIRDEHDALNLEYLREKVSRKLYFIMKRETVASLKLLKLYTFLRRITTSIRK